MIIYDLDGNVLIEVDGDSRAGVDLRGADLIDANLAGAYLSYSSLTGAILSYSNLAGAILRGVDLRGAYLRGADLTGANLTDAILRGADLTDAILRGADLTGANLTDAILRGADLTGADLTGADLGGACLTNASFDGANLDGVRGLVKLIGVYPGNYYWKRFKEGLKNNDYQFKVGLNTLRDDEVFASDPRVLCSYPGFHFASREWCKRYYPNKPLEALIQIPEDAQINEPWASDGKASADKIIIHKVFNTETGEEVTDSIEE